jgi:hypothetical protein
VSLARALTMIISTTTILTVLAASGCRTRHLGDDSGRAYREAFADQRAADGPGPRFGVDVAAGALAARRQPPAQPVGATMTTPTLAIPTIAAPVTAAPIAIEAR